MTGAPLLPFTPMQIITGLHGKTGNNFRFKNTSADDKYDAPVELHRGDLVLLDVLGQGQFGQVSKGSLAITRSALCPFVVKFSFTCHFLCSFFMVDSLML